MCEGCYEEYGRPRKVTSGVIVAVTLLHMLYRVTGVGGPAHVVSDDWNIEDEHVQFCLKQCDDQEYPVEERDAARAFLWSFVPLDEDERATALALFWGIAP